MKAFNEKAAAGGSMSVEEGFRLIDQLLKP
jgi:hypothetical protein